MPTVLQFGMTYHLYNRGVNRVNLFNSDENYRYFLQLFVRHVAPIAQVYAYCLLPNHFHFLLRLRERDDILGNHELRQFWTHTESDRPHLFFSNWFNAYARAFNRRYQRTGSLFQRPFGRKPIITQQYMAHLIRYIHRNPQTHGLVNEFRAWPYSSYDAILHDKPTRVDKTAVFNYFDSPTDFTDFHQTEPDLALLAPFFE